MRVTPAGHLRILGGTGWATAVITVALPYFISGISRYSFFSLTQPLQFARIMAIGAIGWGLVTVVMQIGGASLGADPRWSVTARLAAQAHMPLGAASVAIYGLSFALQAFTASRVVALVTALAWFPAAVVAATAVAARTSWKRAVLPGLGAATVWWLAAGLPLIRLIGHLL